MKPALVIVKQRVTERGNGAEVLPLFSGVAIPSRRYGRDEGPIKKTLRVAKEGQYFVIFAASNSHIFKAAKAVGAKVEVRKLQAKNQFGVWVKKPVPTV